MPALPVQKMPFNRVFPNPVVQSVSLEIRFPNLFYLEGKIGDFQIRVMREFPESELAIRRNFFVSVGADENAVKEQISAQGNQPIDKVWQFKSGAGVTLALTSKNLTLVSERHKSYCHGEVRFRDAIATAVESFQAVAQVPVFTRIGLRYIDKCPVVERTTALVRAWYDTSLPLDRFPVEDASDLETMAVVNRDGCRLRLHEAMKQEGDSSYLFLDFDAWSESVESAHAMGVIDRLHEAIGTEFERIARQPLIDYMNRPREEAHAHAAN